MIHFWIDFAQSFDALNRMLEQRTSLVNQLRAFFLERGLVVRPGRAYLLRVFGDVMAEAEQIVSPRMFRLMSAIAEQ